MPNLQVPHYALRLSRTEAPSLARHYPASPVLQASPSPQDARPVPRGRPVCSNSSTPWGFPCCARLPGVHAVANTPAQRLSSSSLDPSVVSVFPGSGAGSTCAFSISRIARRSLALRPAHSRRHQSRDALHQRLRLLRYLHSRSGCFRLEHRRVGFSPTGRRRLFTAHALTGNLTNALE